MATDALLKLARASERINAVTDLADAWLQTDDFKIERVRTAAPRCASG